MMEAQSWHSSVDGGRHWASIRSLDEVSIGEEISQCTQVVNPMVFQCWSSVADGGPTLNHHWVSTSKIDVIPRNRFNIDYSFDISIKLDTYLIIFAWWSRM